MVKSKLNCDVCGEQVAENIKELEEMQLNGAAMFSFSHSISNIPLNLLCGKCWKKKIANIPNLTLDEKEED